MRTDTSEYVNSHGRNPRGRGLWMFRMIGTDGNGRFTDYVGEATGTMAEARATVARRFKQEVGGVQKVTEAIVLP